MLSTLNKFPRVIHGNFQCVTRSASVFRKIFESWEKEITQAEPTLIKEKNEKLLMSGPVNKDKYRLIYGFPSIRYPAAFVSLQRPLVFCTVLLVPICHFLENTGSLAIGVLFISFNQYLVMRICGLVLQDLIGAIYVNKTGDINEVIIASLKKNGRRVNRRHDPNNLLYYGFPNKYYKACGYGRIIDEKDSISYKLNVRSYKIYDQKAFTHIVGNIS